ncbi:MAG: NAD(P)/FAD-dependent oxidoreductase [Candidatus Bathyarchaeia archaeon]
MENDAGDFDVVVVGGGPSGALSALKCAELGLKVLILERELDDSKPCGGLLTPSCKHILSELLRREIPSYVMCSPASLKVFYVPPDSESGGCMKGFRLLNLHRDLFDRWLRGLAAEAGADIWYKTDFIRLESLEPVQIIARRDDHTIRIKTKYLIGADGVYSRVRSQLYPNAKAGKALVLQEHWRADGDFKDCFYVFLRSELTSAYSYVIPKDNLTVVGVYAPKMDYATLKTRVDMFKSLLREEFHFKPHSLKKREVWAVPYGFILEGVGNAILVGDAAGFCNTLTGEGIKHSLESALAAANSVRNAALNKGDLASIYKEKVREISSFLQRVHQLATSLTDEDRRQFVNFVRACN